MTVFQTLWSKMCIEDIRYENIVHEKRGHLNDAAHSKCVSCGVLIFTSYRGAFSMRCHAWFFAFLKRGMHNFAVFDPIFIVPKQLNGMLSFRTKCHSRNQLYRLATLQRFEG